MARLTSISFEPKSAEETIAEETVVESFESQEFEATEVKTVASVAPTEDKPLERTAEVIEEEINSLSAMLAEENAFVEQSEKLIAEKHAIIEDLTRQVGALESEIRELYSEIGLHAERIDEITFKVSTYKEELAKLKTVYIVAPMYHGKRLRHSSEITSEDNNLGIEVVTNIPEVCPACLEHAEKIGVDSIIRYRKMHRFVQLVLNFQNGNEELRTRYGTKFEVVCNDKALLKLLELEGFVKA